LQFQSYYKARYVVQLLTNQLNVYCLWKEDCLLRSFNYFTLPNCRV